MASFEITRLAIPAVTALIAFLAYSSQYLFQYIAPSPLDKNQVTKFNILVACIWVCYFRACFTDPGHVPSGWKPADSKGNPSSAEEDELQFDTVLKRQRWCRRCEASKPPRAHHCKICQRCVPKMDHHCPWTANCVSHYTFPHFIRFLFYAVTSMSYLEYFLYIRASVVWQNRHMPSYYGPSLIQLSHLLLLVFTNSIVLLMLSILLLRAIWMLAQNQTTIEGWEIERHQTLVRRAKVFGGYLDGPDGIRIRIRKQEFPYDIGIWRNIRDWMGGTGNILMWFFPFAATPTPGTGLDFEVNGFEAPSVSWPPPDPDRIPRRREQQNLSHPETLLYPNPVQSSYADATLTSDSVAAFRRRQEADLLRHRRGRQTGPSASTRTSSAAVRDSGIEIQRQPRFHKRYRQDLGNSEVNDIGNYDDNNDYSDGDSYSETDGSASGEEGWRNAEGERLRDFGVDEDAEFYDYEDRGNGGANEAQAQDASEDEDDIPLAKLMERRKREREKADAMARS